MHIAIITGGNTGEKTVSIDSAINIASFINFAGVEIFVFPEELNKFLDQYSKFDLAIPMIHGAGGEDGSLQGLLENLGIPYIFSEVTPHAIGIDKKLTKKICAGLGHKTAREVGNTDYPFFAKPRFGGSSVNVGLCKNQSDYDKLDKSAELMHEEPLSGREFSVGVVDLNGQSVVLPVVEIVPLKDTPFDYEQKYNPEKLAQEICPPEISEHLSDRLKTVARDMHNELGVKHASRSDFIITPEEEVVFLEINTIPGMTKTSLIPKMLKTAGIDLTDLLKQWCEERAHGQRSEAK